MNFWKLKGTYQIMTGIFKKRKSFKFNREQIKM